MTVYASSWNAQGPLAQERRAAMLARIAQWRALEERSAAASAKSRPVFDKRGQLLPRLSNTGRDFADAAADRSSSARHWAMRASVAARRSCASGPWAFQDEA